MTTGSYGGNAFLSEDGFLWRGASRVALDPQGTTFLPDKIALTSPVNEKEQLGREKRESLISSFLINSAPGSFALFCVFQYLALKRMCGIWRFWAILPLITGVSLVAITAYDFFFVGGGLSPLFLIFLMPVHVVYLAAILLLHKLFGKQTPRQIL